MVSTRQLHDLGLNNSAIRVRVRKGHLHRIHHGVYAIGHAGISLNAPVSGGRARVRSTRRIARPLAAGRSTAALTWDGRVPEVIRPRIRGQAPGAGYSRAPRARRSIPARRCVATSRSPGPRSARTLLDLADDHARRALRRADPQEPRRLSLTAACADAPDVLGREPNGRRGAKRLAASSPTGPARRAAASRKFTCSTCIDGAGLRPPRSTVRVGRVYYPDLRWPAQRAHRRVRQRDLARRQARPQGRRRAPSPPGGVRRTRAAGHLTTGAQAAAPHHRADRRRGGARSHRPLSGLASQVGPRAIG